MHRPNKARYHFKTDLISLRFSEDKDCEEFHRKESLKFQKELRCRRCDRANDNNGSYVSPHMIRGAIVWPVGEIPGYLLVSGQDVRDPNRTVWIFKESPFTNVGTDSAGRGGLWTSLKTSWEDYLCLKYFYAESPEHLRFSQQVRREGLVEVKPVFIKLQKEQIGTKNKSNVDNLILEYQSQGKIKYDGEYKFENGREFGALKGNLYKQVRAWQDGLVLDEDEIPAYKALRALIAGLEWRPYREPMEPEQMPESYYA